MKHLFVINPAAGQRDQTLWFQRTIQSVFEGRGEPYEIAVSAGPGGCKAAALAGCREAAGRPLRIYACGGDGTLNEAVNGAVGFPNVAVTHFPGGSGNDFIKIFSDPAAFSDLNRLADGDEAVFDLMEVNGKHYALNICSVGFDARIGTAVGHYRRLPFVNGTWAYILSTAVHTVKGIHRPFTVELDTGEVFDGRQTLICVANGRWYGGGFNPVPEARPDDGLLEVLLVKPVSRLTVARVIGKYKAGLHAQYPQYISHRACRSIRVRCGEPSPVNLDGELLTAEEAVFRVADEKIRFVYPKGLTWHDTAGDCRSKPAE